MAKLDVKRLVKKSLERVKQSEHVRDTDPSIVHLEENVVRSIAELEVARAERVAANPNPSRAPSAKPRSSPENPDQDNANHFEALRTHARRAA